MTDPTDVIERAQAWLAEADKKDIRRTDREGYLAVIEDLVAEVEFQRTALQGYRNRQLELTDELAAAPQPKAEPVAWMDNHLPQGPMFISDDVRKKAKNAVLEDMFNVPLYAHPAPRTADKEIVLPPLPRAAIIDVNYGHLFLEEQVREAQRAAILADRERR